MSKLYHFRDLAVYQNALEAALLIHQTSKSFPTEERYSLTDQVRRSSRSVCANLAEAWRKRRYSAAFISKLSDSDAETAETQVWLELAHRTGLINEDTFADLDRRYDRIAAQLVTMINSPEKWTLPAKKGAK